MPRPSGKSKHRCYHQQRKDRQDRAVERADSYARLTLDEKLALCASRPGDSKREKARLNA